MSINEVVACLSKLTLTSLQHADCESHCRIIFYLVCQKDYRQQTTVCVRYPDGGEQTETGEGWRRSVFISNAFIK